MSAPANGVLILSEDQSLINTLLSDIEMLGYTAFGESLNNFKAKSILRQDVAVILFDFTRLDSDILRIYQGLKGNVKLENQGVNTIILASEDSLSKIPLTLEYDGLILANYNPCELGFRIKRLFWQKDKVSDQEVIQVGDIVIYLARYEVWVKGKMAELTFKEYELLKYLITHRGRAFNRESLLNIIWGYDYYGGTRTVDVHIRHIRVKIGDTEGEYIKTVRGVGYMFNG